MGMVIGFQKCIFIQKWNCGTKERPYGEVGSGDALKIKTPTC